MASSSETAVVADRAATAGYALALGDDALVAAQWLIRWVARAPEIEEDVALANIGLDLLGQARALLTYAGSLEDPVRTEDDLAYHRAPADFRNAGLLERDGGDFAVTIVRLLLLAGYQGELYARLAGGPDPLLAAVAAKAVKEVAYHRDHARTWVLRLGDGTPVSHDRAQAALDAEWPWFATLFAPVDGALVDPAAIEPAARAWVRGVLAEATLAVPDIALELPDGRRGEHTDALTAMLDTLGEVARAHPGAQW
ncbi:1,2-phenylacetyl-CoA epoxidase subunit PaaC [Marmoricola sp. RAF53]|uniref:1,2-phenylacetyl-CoA epoxidase subunit PaaC n=1 Tax=Marmoricola sp. RAF53 TaxID=3233059 RepID=UPI003F9A05B0